MFQRHENVVNLIDRQTFATATAEPERADRIRNFSLFDLLHVTIERQPLVLNVFTFCFGEGQRFLSS